MKTWVVEENISDNKKKKKAIWQYFINFAASLWIWMWMNWHYDINFLLPVFDSSIVSARLSMSWLTSTHKTPGRRAYMWYPITPSGRFVAVNLTYFALYDYYWSTQAQVSLNNYRENICHSNISRDISTRDSSDKAGWPCNNSRIARNKWYSLQQNGRMV